MKTRIDRQYGNLFALLIGSLIVCLGSARPVAAQSPPNTPRSSQPPQRVTSPNTQTGARTTTSQAASPNAQTNTTMTTPQAASPNADYALSSVLSRTNDPNDQEDTSIDVKGALSNRLWQNRISAPDPNEDADTRYALRSLIHQVRSVTFPDSAADPTFSAPVEPTLRAPGSPPMPTTGGGTIPSPESSPTASATPATEPVTALPAATLIRLDDLLADPGQVDDPLEMAELLFLSGRAAEAAIFYEKALALLPANDLRSSEDRAWVLFQLGNCLRETDLSRAKDAYMKLIAQYPNSPWAELAKAHGRLINWYQSAQPQQYLSPDKS